jgi:hypothetical protein
VQLDEGDRCLEMLPPELIVEAAGKTGGYNITEKEVAADEQNDDRDSETGEDEFPFLAAPRLLGRRNRQRRRSR